MEATQEDVARAAGVSAATVSRCLNRPDIVRPALQAKVEAAIRALDYVPHGAARSLASRRSRMIGAIFPSLDSALFGGALEALQSEIAESGHTLVVASSNYDPARERDHVRNLLASGIDALMLVGGARDEVVYRLAELAFEDLTIKGLHDVFVRPGFHGLADIVELSFRGAEHDDGRSPATLLSQLTKEVDPVHDRHVPVKQDGVWHACHARVQCLFAVFGFVDVEVQRLEDLARDRANYLRIIHN